MILGVTGSRSFVSSEQLDAVREILATGEYTELHHGDCVGVDHAVAMLADEYDLRTVAHPPVNERHRAFHASTVINPPDEYLARNRTIVNSCDLLLALPHRSETLRSGTWATVRYAEHVHRLVTLLFPPGVSR